MPIDNLIIMTRLFLFPKGTLISRERAWIEAEDIYLRIYSSKPQHRGYRAPETSTRQKLTRKSMKTTLRDLPGTFSKGNLWTWHSTKWQITTYWYFHSKDLVKKVRKRSFALPFHNKMPSFMLIISRMLKISRQRYPEYCTFPTIWCGAWKCEICPLIRQLTAL